MLGWLQNLCISEKSDIYIFFLLLEWWVGLQLSSRFKALLLGALSPLQSLSSALEKSDARLKSCFSVGVFSPSMGAFKDFSLFLELGKFIRVCLETLVSFLILSTWLLCSKNSRLYFCFALHSGEMSEYWACTGSMVGCHLWGHTESGMTEAT